MSITGASLLEAEALCSLAASCQQRTPSVLKATTPSSATIPTATANGIPGGQPLSMHGFLYTNPAASAQALPPPTRQVQPRPALAAAVEESNTTATATITQKSASKSGAKSSVKKSPQLPLFLSKTYHMIDRCDPEIATWSMAGDNFVVKNIEKFASSILPLYFKHSNFSSFARQLNFYGFRKLRSDPILTNDVDPQTAAYVRFYHEKFQKNRPDLLHSIKRATKSGDQQSSKDDVDGLKLEVMKLKQLVIDMEREMERKISEIDYRYGRRISDLTADYDNLAVLVTELLKRQQPQLHPQPHQQNQFPMAQHQQQVSSHHHLPRVPPVVETTTVNMVPASTAVMKSTSLTTSNGGSCGVSSADSSTTNSGHIGVPSADSSSSLSYSTTASSVSASSPRTENKMQSLSHAAAMNLIANAATGAASESAVVGSKRKIVRIENDESSSAEAQSPTTSRRKVT